MKAGCAALARFCGDERGEGTGTSAVRIALWAVIALAVAGLVGPSVYRVAVHTAHCADAAASGATAC